MSTSTSTTLANSHSVNGKQSPSSGSLNGSNANGSSTPQNAVPQSMITIASSPSIGKVNAPGSPLPSSPGINHSGTDQIQQHASLNNTLANNPNYQDNRVKIDYNFDEYEDQFFAKAIINDPLKISLIPDLLHVNSAKRQTKIVGPNVPGDIVQHKLPVGVQESIQVFNQDWTVVTRDAMPIPALGLNQLKPLPVQSYEIDGDYDNKDPKLVETLNQELVQIAAASNLEFSKVTEVLKNQRSPLFQTYFSDELPAIDQPKQGAAFTDQVSLQFQVECTEFKTLIGDIEPFFGRMFLFDANQESPRDQIISEVFHFDFGTHQELLPKSTEVEPPAKIKKAIFSVNRPSTHIYLIVCFDKVMRGDPEETTKIYFNLPGKPKEIAKFKDEIKDSLPRLGSFRQSFVWGCIELFDNNNNFIYTTPNVNIKVNNISKIKGDLYSFVTKEKKQTTNWVDCSVKIALLNGDASDSASQVGRIDHLLRPVYNDNPAPMIREVYNIQQSSEQDLNISYSNVLYFYPNQSLAMKSKSICPAHLTPNHHLLVTFYHLGCRPSKKNEKPEVCLGYCAIRLFENEQIIVDGKYKKPVASVFPPKYLDMEAKEQVNTKMWVDNKKPVFSFRTRLVSSIYPQDPLLSFLLKDGAESDQNILIETFRKINDVPNTLKLKFFPAISRIIFKCISTTSKELQKQALIALITIVDSISKELKAEDKLMSYITYVFSNGSTTGTNLYESLVQTWIYLLESRDEKSVISLHYAWFLFGIIRKSMILDIDIKNLLRNGRNRTNRFTDDYLQKFKSLFELLLIQLKQIYSKSIIAKSFITSTAYFITDLFDIIKRGFLFRLIHSYIIGLDSSNSVMELTDLKFTFLRVLASSDSFIALNLPTTHQFPNIVDFYQHFYKKHFLIGIILQEVGSTITANEKEMRLKAILTLREIMSRNDVNPNYNHPQIRERIATLYLPYILIVVDNVELINNFDETESRYWLICFIYVVKNLINSSTNVIVDWWKKEPNKQKIITFFNLLSTSVSLFEYQGRQAKGQVKQLNRETAKALLEQYTNNISGPKTERTYSVSSSSDRLVGTSTSTTTSSNNSSNNNGASSNPSTSPAWKTHQSFMGSSNSSVEPITSEALSIMSGNLSHEVSMTVLNTLVYYIKDYKHELHGQSSKTSSAMKLPEKRDVTLDRIFKVLTMLMKKRQSYAFVKIGFQVLTSVISEYKIQLFKENNTICSELTPEIFKYCTTNHAPNRQYATTLIFLMILSNHKLVELFSRMKLQSTVSISKIVSEKVQDFESLLTFLETIKLQMDPTKTQQTVLISKIATDKIYSDFESFLSYLESMRSSNPEISAHVSDFDGLHAFIGNAKQQPSSPITKLLTEPLVKDIDGYIHCLKNMNVSDKILNDFDGLCQCLKSICGFIKHAFEKSTVLKNAEPNKVVAQMEELYNRLIGIINNSVKIQQHGYDPEKKADLYHLLSNSFSESPDLRITWLKSLATFLQNNNNWEEAGQTYIIAAAFVCGYLGKLGRLPKNLEIDFKMVSPNFEVDRNSLPDPALLKAVQGEICQLEDFTEKGFINLVKEAIKVLKRGSFFESCIQTYQLVLPTFHKNRDWKRQYECYSELVVFCNQMISESAMTQRLFANYYRVAFYGKELLKDMHGKEYIYKELNYVRLSDLSDRLQRQYGDKFGADKIKLLPNKPVDVTTLLPNLIYFQIISVDPYHTQDELKERVASFDQNTNLNKFIFEVPFTKSGKAHSDSITDQWKRKTIITTESYFPYLKKRIPILKKEDIEITPIEVAIELIQKKSNALKAELNSGIQVNTKTLQINLQGSLLLQVNAGPLAICSSFLGSNDFEKHNAEHFTRLQDSIREFTKDLGFAIKLNEKLTKADDLNGQELHFQLEKGYREFREKVHKQYVNLDQNDFENRD
ncbi:DOCK family protein [Heterostelium album PN500]|uniref:DOCK family protein n=1 Tax=Heterostelium pallidum (strain ATCC 26659 / Pp 5 / PN500) TaxID=670386 RepID=D3BKQ4_HETP5|nr:DOCK family protein [Heterostelium album PN500]EFA78484.1 DOCK family protein [Heterostelium album PN500]|eukprot:XP_020430608.1 DOCK family protein [Heterostelium album PN500]